MTRIIFPPAWKRDNLAVSNALTRSVLRDAFIVYAAWVVATYLLEGLQGTLLRTDAVGLRLAYALIANLGIGILAPLWLIGKRVKAGWGSEEDFGFGSARKAAASTLAAAAVGYGLFRLGQSEPLRPLVLLNGFAQVWVVSVAEVTVCWALVGGALFGALRGWSRWGGYLIAAAVASVLFGAYHFAHSPPFNQPAMVVFLTGIGVVTSLWWFASRDIYGTAVFHNFFGVTGVLAAMKASGRVAEHAAPAWPLLGTAIVVTAVLMVAAAVWVRRNPDARPARSS